MEIQTSARTLAKAIYLEFINSFLTVEGFAEHHKLQIEDAKELIDVCRKIEASRHPDS